MSRFDLREAKCTLETDRLAIERIVLDLFDVSDEGRPSFSVEELEELEARSTQENWREGFGFRFQIL